jgi:hypothetical protein
VPIRFEEVSVVKRPRRRAPEAWKQYRQDVKQHNLSQRFVQTMEQLRAALDQAGGHKKILVIAGDGSFCNRTVFARIVPRTELIARCRQDAVLCFHAPAASRCFYDPCKFTPEQVRRDETRPWQTTKLFYGGKRHKIRFKEVCEVYWQGGARRRLLRLFVIAPTAYRKRRSGRLLYRRPAFLLTADLGSSARQLLQIYFDRWQIEVNHREEKDTLGVGQAQLWNANSVPKEPVLRVASYSALLLAALQAFGTERGAAFAQLPRWRRHAKRPSCLDLITLLRHEAVTHPHILAQYRLNYSDHVLHAAAAA